MPLTRAGCGTAKITASRTLLLRVALSALGKFDHFILWSANLRKGLGNLGETFVVFWTANLRKMLRNLGEPQFGFLSTRKERNILLRFQILILSTDCQKRGDFGSWIFHILRAWPRDALFGRGAGGILERKKIQ